MKSFGADTGRVTERFGVATQEEIERFDLVPECFSLVEICKWPNNCRTTDCRATDGWQVLKGYAPVSGDRWRKRGLPPDTYHQQ
jgi:hypothetical protein